MVKTLHTKIAAPAIFSFFLLLWTGCRDIETDPTGLLRSKPTAEFSADLPRDWMDLGYNTIKRQGMFALDASRTYAYMAITMHEAMVHGIPDGRSLAGQLQGLNRLPTPDADKTYDWGMVLCHAMPQVMTAIIPNISIDADFFIDQLEREQETALRRDHEIAADVVEDSKAFADELAEAIIAWSRTDNRLGMESLKYSPPSRAGHPEYYAPTTPGTSFMMPFWWTSRPFVIPSYTLCEVMPPYEYSTNPNSLYYKDMQEVVDATQDPVKVNIGRYWANNPGQSGSPAGSWLGIANQLVDQLNIDIETALRMYVSMTIGTRDGFIACWYMKYKYNLQRPATFIREVMGLPNWESPVPTPPYPDYTSGTSVNAGCSSEILTHYFGSRSFKDAQHQDKGFGIRDFTNFKQAGIEAFHSRIYGGVHMRRACELGFRQGECIGKHVLETIRFTTR
jgi:PAP2 superfamily